MAKVTKQDIHDFIEIESTLISLEKYADLPVWQKKWVTDARRKISNLKYQFEDKYINDKIYE
tara:strand:- start:230 stop:415 length:186 start_codon:yes stop_codon:yes gene_type:complete